MRTLLVPVLLVGVIPGLLLAHRLGLLRRRAGQVGVTALAMIAVLAALPFQGLAIGDLKRIQLLIAGAATVLLAIRHLQSGRARPWYRPTLLGLTALAVLVQVNFFAFHGQRVFVHLHDVAHYYLGAKYFKELGYSGLYTAMLRAEAERYDNHFRTIDARDLSTNRIVHIRELLRASDPVKASFSSERWAAFSTDVAMFRDRLGDQYGAVLTDHGFNPSPAWVVMGSALANRVPAGSYRGLVSLTLIDPLLLLVTLGAVVWAFGRRGAILATLHVCLVFGAGFSWTGGAFLRAPWFAATVIGLCFVHRSRWAAGGSLLAFAACLRLFPAAFLVGLALKAVNETLVRRRAPARFLLLGGSFVVTCGVLVGLTALGPRGLHSWPDFAARMQVQVGTISPNLVGLTQTVALRPGPTQVTQEQLWRLAGERQRLYRWQLAIVLPMVLVLMLPIAGRVTAFRAALLGVPLLLVGANLGGYYYAMLALFVLAHRASAGALALIFAVEFASFALLGFADREATVYALRTLLLIQLMVALYWHPGADLVRRIRAGGRCGAT
jgi:hypothetical protein